MNRKVAMRKPVTDFRASNRKIMLGCMILFLGIFFVAWNETKAVDISRNINSIMEEINEVCDASAVDKNYDNTLVYIHGSIYVEEPLSEPDYGLSIPAVILKRRVQMYQWVEKKNDNKFSMEESHHPFQYYEKDWRDKLVDSSKFNNKKDHENPNKFPIHSYMHLSERVRIGDYVLSQELKEKFSDFMLITSDERPERRDIKMHAGLYYHSADVWNPEVGDVRIQFSYAGISGDIVSIIGTLRGNVISDGGLLILEKGKILPEDMVIGQHTRNVWIVRLYRTLGWLSLYAASTFFTATLYPFRVSYKKLYLYVTLDKKFSPNGSIATLLLGTVISSCWMVYKPWISAIILLTFVSPYLCMIAYISLKSYNDRYKKI